MIVFQNQEEVQALEVSQERMPYLSSEGSRHTNDD